MLQTFLPRFILWASILIWCEQCIRTLSQRTHAHIWTHIKRPSIDACPTICDIDTSAYVPVGLCFFLFRMLTFKLFGRHALGIELSPILWIFSLLLSTYIVATASYASSSLRCVLFSSTSSNCINNNIKIVGLGLRVLISIFRSNWTHSSDKTMANHSRFMNQWRHKASYFEPKCIATFAHISIPMARLIHVKCLMFNDTFVLFDNICLLLSK